MSIYISQRTRSSLEKRRITPYKNSRKDPLHLSLKKVKNWLNTKNLQPSDGFFELANAGLGKSTNIGSKFSIEALRLAFEKHRINIAGQEVYF